MLKHQMNTNCVASGTRQLLMEHLDASKHRPLRKTNIKSETNIRIFNCTDSMSSGIVSDASSNLSPDLRSATLPKQTRRSDRHSTESCLSVHFGATEVHEIPRIQEIESPIYVNTDMLEDEPVTTDYVDIDVDTVLEKSAFCANQGNSSLPVLQIESQSQYNNCTTNDTSDETMIEFEENQQQENVGYQKMVLTDLDENVSIVTDANQYDQCPLLKNEEKMCHFMKWWSQLSTPSDFQHKECPINQLSDGLLLHIMSFLPLYNMTRNSRVCKRWYNLVWHPLLWQNVSFEESNIDTMNAIDTVSKILSYQSNDYPRCTAIKHIKIHNSTTTTDQCMVIAAQRCNNLESLELVKTPRITNLAMFELLRLCPKLTCLKVNHCNQISRVCIPRNANVHELLLSSQLTSVDVSYCDQIKDVTIVEMTQQCPRLKRLIMRRCYRLTDDSLIVIGKNCASLQELNISENSTLTDTGLGKLSQQIGSSLRQVSLSECCNITDKGLIKLAKYSNRIKYLNVRKCSKITDIGLEKFIESNGSRLQSLNISYCDITDETLFCLSKNSHGTLVRLNIRGNDTVTNTGVNKLVNKCVHLKLLNIMECSVTKSIVSHVRRSLPHCTVTYTCIWFL